MKDSVGWKLGMDWFRKYKSAIGVIDLLGKLDIWTWRDLAEISDYTDRHGVFDEYCWRNHEG